MGTPLFAVFMPYSKRTHKLPSLLDVERISGLTRNAFSSAGGIHGTSKAQSDNRASLPARCSRPHRRAPDQPDCRSPPWNVAKGSRDPHRGPQQAALASRLIQRCLQAVRIYTGQNDWLIGLSIEAC
jgi:hypothetical protein